jgi:hypothetical protein
LQNSTAFLYTKNEHIEKEDKKIILFTIASKKATTWELTKDVKDLYMENYKPLKKKSKETTEDGKVSHAYGLAEST